MEASDAARSLYEEGLAAFRAGDAERAKQLTEDSLRTARDAGDRHGVALASIGLARVAFRAGDLTEGRRLAGEVEQLAKELGDDELAVMALHVQAEMLRGELRYAEAVPLYEQTIERHRAAGNDRMLAMELYNCGAVLALMGEGERALQMLRESLVRARDGGHEYLVLYCLLGLAGAAVAGGRAADAARLVAAGKTGFERRNEVLDPAEAAEVEATESAIAAALPPEELEAARAEGAAMSPDEAAAVALDE